MNNGLFYEKRCRDCKRRLVLHFNETHVQYMNRDVCLESCMPQTKKEWTEMHQRILDMGKWWRV